MEDFQQEAEGMREVRNFWMRIVRDDDEKTADRIRASELWAKTAAREQAPDEAGLSEADRALLHKVAERLAIPDGAERGGRD